MRLAKIARGKFFMVIVTMALVCGCARMQTEKRMISLDDSVRAYSKMLRWGEYEEAARYILFREREPEKIDIDVLEKIKITGYEVYDREITTEQDEASISVSIEYYHKDTGIVYSIKDKQIWWFNEEGKRWFLDDTLPDFLAPIKRRVR